jgi:hypothetical protein
VHELNAVRPPHVRCECFSFLFSFVHGRPVDVLEMHKGKSTETCFWWVVQSFILCHPESLHEML